MHQVPRDTRLALMGDGSSYHGINHVQFGPGILVISRPAGSVIDTMQ